MTVEFADVTDMVSQMWREIHERDRSVCFALPLVHTRTVSLHIPTVNGK